MVEMSLSLLLVLFFNPNGFSAESCDKGSCMDRVKNLYLSCGSVWYLGHVFFSILYTMLIHFILFYSIFVPLFGSWNSTYFGALQAYQKIYWINSLFNATCCAAHAGILATCISRERMWLPGGSTEGALKCPDSSLEREGVESNNVLEKIEENETVYCSYDPDERWWDPDAFLSPARTGGNGSMQ